MDRRAAPSARTRSRARSRSSPCRSSRRRPRRPYSSRHALRGVATAHRGEGVAVLQVRPDEAVQVAFEHRLRAAGLHVRAHVFDQLVRVQDVPRDVAVLHLRALLLRRDDDPRRQVVHANRGLRLVDILAARAAGFERFDFEVVGLDLDVARVAFFHLRHHVDLGERRLAAALVVERRDAHEPVHAALALEHAVRVLAADDECDRAQTGFVPGRFFHDVRFVAVVLGPAQVHAPEHLRPVGRVGAARARADRHDRAVRVIRAVEVRCHLQFVERLDGARERRFGFRLSAGFVAEHVEDLGSVGQRSVDRIDGIEVRAQVGDPLHDAACPLGIAPEVVRARARLELGYAAALAGIVKAAPEARSGARGRGRWRKFGRLTRDRPGSPGVGDALPEWPVSSTLFWAATAFDSQQRPRLGGRRVGATWVPAKVLRRKEPMRFFSAGAGVMSTNNWFRLCVALAILFIIAGNVVFATGGFFNAGNPLDRNILLRGFFFFIAAAFPVLLFYLILKQQLGAGRGHVEDSSIDSVYYLGFLITLITLLATVISYGIFDLGDAKKAAISVIFIGVSFGLSLASTALALFARIDLIQQRDALAFQSSPPLDSLISKRLFELDENYRRLSAIMADASHRFEITLKSNNAAVDAHVAEIAKAAKDSLTDVVQAATNAVSSAQETLREATERSIDTISANNAALFKQMENTIEHVKATLLEFVRDAALKASSSELTKAATAVTSSLKKASTELTAVFIQFEDLQKRAASSIQSFDNLNSHVQGATASARAANEILAQTARDASVLDIEPARTRLKQLDNSVSTLEGAVVFAGNQYVGASEKAIGAMRDTTQDLEAATSELSSAFTKLSHELARAASTITRGLK